MACSAVGGTFKQKGGEKQLSSFGSSSTENIKEAQVITRDFTSRLKAVSLQCSKAQRNSPVNQKILPFPNKPLLFGGKKILHEHPFNYGQILFSFHVSKLNMTSMPLKSHIKIKKSILVHQTET